MWVFFNWVGHRDYFEIWLLIQLRIVAVVVAVVNVVVVAVVIVVVDAVVIIVVADVVRNITNFRTTHARYEIINTTHIFLGCIKVRAQEYHLARRVNDFNVNVKFVECGNL